ncbi:hypothetical protein HMPREF9413_0580 [Paenibacillus sp. HGF7]|nr:hypothetical protein HMPREF9413_0580 [Paenibacillus sp. HGF7]
MVEPVFLFSLQPTNYFYNLLQILTQIRNIFPSRFASLRFLYSEIDPLLPFSPLRPLTPIRVSEFMHHSHHFLSPFKNSQAKIKY